MIWPDMLWPAGLALLTVLLVVGIGVWIWGIFERCSGDFDNGWGLPTSQPPAQPQPPPAPTAQEPEVKAASTDDFVDAIVGGEDNQA